MWDLVADCPFCLRNPEQTGRVALENEHCLFLTGVERVLEGSGVIVPRAHRATVFELTPALAMSPTPARGFGIG